METPPHGFWRREGWPLLVLLFSFLLFFKNWNHPFNQFFLSLDLSVLYEPVYFWVHQHLLDGKLPLICDNAMHGAPIAAYSMAGVLSPALWLFHWVSSSFTFVFNLLFLAPQMIYLTGAYFLGRKLNLSRSASLLLAFFWAYNGHQMAQLDHLNVAWAHAFFPWAFLALLVYLDCGEVFWLLLSSLLMGLNLFSGHPQVFFMECLFFLFWALFSNSYSFKKRLAATALMGLGALIVASPLILFTGECLWGDFQTHWSAIDRFYHSWTPLNFMTLIYPWFFGKTQFDRIGADYWWQYQFVEMQVAFSIVGLFFILYFFLRKSADRKWITLTFLFALFMAMGKFAFVYSLIQSLPIFSFFRDPARYWFLATWVLGLGAAFGWDQWFGDEKNPGKKMALCLAGITIGIPILALVLRVWAWDWLVKMASYLASHLIASDAEHPQPLTFYLAQVPVKLKVLFFNLDPTLPRVFLPILFSCGMLTAVLTRNKWNSNWLKVFLLLLIIADLFVFRMPLGNAFYKPSDITPPKVPAPQNRSLTLLQNNVSPLPGQYGEMAYPNMNLMFDRPNLVFDANPIPRRYADLWAKLGWFSWVYKDRDPIGFSHYVRLLKTLGIDQIVSDAPLKLPKPFVTIQKHYPFTYGLDSVNPKAYIPQMEIREGNINFQTGKTTERKIESHEPKLVISKWDETRISLFAIGEKLTFSIDDDPGTTSDFVLQKTYLPGWNAKGNGIGEKLTFSTDDPRTTSVLVLQKTYLPGWNAKINGHRVAIKQGRNVLATTVPLEEEEYWKNFEVLMSIPLEIGNNQVELNFEPAGLRLGFFLFFGFFSAFTFFLFRSRLS